MPNQEELISFLGELTIDDGQDELHTFELPETTMTLTEDSQLNQDLVSDPPRKRGLQFNVQRDESE